MNPTIKSALLNGKNTLRSNGIVSYSLDSEILLMDTLKINKIELYTKNDYILNENELNIYNEKIARRIKNEPIAYIIGKCEFMGLDFYVNKNTLIPRPDTEILIETILYLNNEYKFKNILDIGTGSGAIIISLCKNICDCNGSAIDISPDTLLVAKENARYNDVLDKINFINSDLFNALDKLEYDLIVSNPPYIPSNDIESLDDNVKFFEPHLALNGGKDGLYFYKNIVNDCLDFLRPGGILIFEIGYDQGKDVSNLMSSNFIDINVIKDLSGLDRVVYGKRR